jgi:hypothetical protein
MAAQAADTDLINIFFTIVLLPAQCKISVFFSLSLQSCVLSHPSMTRILRKIKHSSHYPWYHLAGPKSRRHIPRMLISQKTPGFV